MDSRIEIGRDLSCDILVEDSYRDVSRSHAVVFQDGDALVLEDHSTNGSYVNGEPISHTVRKIAPGDVIRLGKSYILSWSRLKDFFPEICANVQVRTGRSTSQFLR